MREVLLLKPCFLPPLFLSDMKEKHTHTTFSLCHLSSPSTVKKFSSLPSCCYMTGSIHPPFSHPSLFRLLPLVVSERRVEGIECGIQVSLACAATQGDISASEERRLLHQLVFSVDFPPLSHLSPLYIALLSLLS